MGGEPLVMEPVRARISLAGTGRRVREVCVLDHDGRRTDRTVPVQDDAFTIDGTRDRALYYEIVLE
ncbi:MAG: hypothetical protein ACLFRD_04035 [Nitriliruptoraceae bacterium]